MSSLIDAGLASDDQRVRRLAQSLREDALFWNEFISIVDAESPESISSKSIVEKAFRDYDDPRNAETQVALPPTGGYV